MKMNGNRRDEFLLHLYDRLWGSIDRTEGGLWQFLGLYVGIIGVYWIAGRGGLNPTVAAYLTITASFWGINIAINAGKWFERNRMMIINVEKRFLDPDDLGRIIPTSYHDRRPRKLFTVLDRIHAIVFTFFLALSVWRYWDELSKTNDAMIVAMAFVAACVLGTFAHWYCAWREVIELVQDTERVEREWRKMEKHDFSRSQ